MKGLSVTCDDNKSPGRGVWSEVVNWVDTGKEGGEDSEAEIRKKGRKKMLFLKCFKYLSFLFVYLFLNTQISN